MSRTPDAELNRTTAPVRRRRTMKRMLPLAMLMAAATLLASDPAVGTWKLNLAKSKFSPGPPPKSVTTTISEDDGWLVSKAEGVDSEGKPINVENRVKKDGKEYPYQSPWGKGTVVVKGTDPNHWTQVVKLEGGNTIATKIAISKDGKTRTSTSTGTNAKGEKVNSVAVSERQ
jgi:hypothetical protein